MLVVYTKNIYYTNIISIGVFNFMPTCFLLNPTLVNSPIITIN